MSTTRPARRYIAEARQMETGVDRGWWLAYWAFPGMIPTYVGGDLAVTFRTKAEADTVAKLALADALLSRFTTTDKPERYEHMPAAEFAADLRDAGLTPTAFARLFGTTQAKVVTDWIGGLKPIPHSARVLLSLFLRHPETIDMAEEMTAKHTTPRHEFAEEEVSPAG